MTVTLKLSEEQERRMLDGAERQDEEAVRKALTEALDTYVAGLLETMSSENGAPRRLDDATFKSRSEELIETFRRHRKGSPLPAGAFTREGIYGDHP